MSKFTTLSELAIALGKWTNVNAWEKGSKKHLYFKGIGYNTKKMTTNVYIAVHGSRAELSVFIECPSQSSTWLNSQREEIRQQMEKYVRYINRYFDFRTTGQPMDVVVNNAILGAQEVKGYFTEWREVRIKINSFGKLAVRNRQFVVAFQGTKDNAPRGFVEMSGPAFEILKVIRGGEDMLEPYAAIPDYDRIAAIRVEHLAKN